MFRKLIDSPWPYFVLAGVLLVAAVLSQFRPVSNEPPAGEVADLALLRERDDLNVLFIVIDTLRADRLHAYGYERETTPNLDALAARGVRFAHVESQSSWTKASMASLWTGMYPTRTGVWRFSHAMPQEAMMPAEIFQEAGFRTAGVWRNGWIANNFGFDQGFDLYIRPSKHRAVGNVQRNNPSVYRLPGTDADATESAMEFLVESGDDRFFLYVHYMDVHQYLYADSSPIWGTSFSDIYDSALHWTDRNVGLLVGALEHQGLLDDTLIVIASDHGEAFFEHGEEGHARNLYREVQEVPLIVVPPFSLSPGVVVQERVANVDIWPTILDIVGLSPIPGAEGQSLVPLVMASGAAGTPVPSEFRERALYAELDRNWGRDTDETNQIVALVKGDYRYIHHLRRPERPELYDRSVDPKEKKNVAAVEGEVGNELRALIDEFLAKPRTQWDEAPEIELDEMKKAQLRALGYVVPSERRKARQKKK